MGSDKLKYGDGLLLFGGASLSYTPPAPPVAPMTLRFSFTDPSYVPTYGPGSWVHKGTWTRVGDALWDWECTDPVWDWCFFNFGDGSNVYADLVGHGDLSGVTSMACIFSGSDSLRSVSSMSALNVPSLISAFDGCSNLVSVGMLDFPNNGNLVRTFRSCSSLVSVGAMDLTNVSGVTSMFEGCTSLVNPPSIMNSSALTTVSRMFLGCTALRSLPDMSFGIVNYAENSFDGCVNVESGILELYTRLSSQPTPPGFHTWCFHNCGANTESGAAELELIPNDWK